MRSVFFGSGPSHEDQRPSDFVIPTPLGPEELRVLGCLIEKQFLTPDVYPLTVNSLVNACNQKTSREPVVHYDEDTCLAVLDMLQHKGLATRITGADHRVPKYRELLGERTNLRMPEIAVLCVMMLRGPQTLNELKERTQRIHEFGTPEEVEATLDRMMQREPQILAVKLPKLPGHKEARYMHLLAGEVSMEDLATATPAPRHSPHDDRIARLEAEVSELRDLVQHLQDDLERFRKQFD
jgi:hypothetical protein